VEYGDDGAFTGPGRNVSFCTTLLLTDTVSGKKSKPASVTFNRSKGPRSNHPLKPVTRR